MDWQTLATGLGAVLTGAGGCVIVIREVRRRDRRALKREVDALSTDVTSLRADLIACRRYAFTLAERLTRAGHVVEAPPELHPDAPE